VGSLKDSLRHAFAVDAPGPAEPSAEEQPVVDWLCATIARKRMAVPGLMLAEMMRPLSYLGAQAMHVTAPAVWALASRQTYAGYEHFARFLERRGSIEYIARRIEHFEAELARARRARCDATQGEGRGEA
jgi:hypothetical protein